MCLPAFIFLLASDDSPRVKGEGEEGGERKREGERGGDRQREM